MVGQATFAEHQAVQQQGNNYFKELSEERINPFMRSFYGFAGSVILVAAVAGSIFGTMTPLAGATMGVIGGLWVAAAATDREIYPKMALIFSLGLFFAGI